MAPAGKAVPALLMAIFSIVIGFCCGLPGGIIGIGLGVAAVLMAKKHQALLQEWNQPPDSTATTAYVLGIVGIVLSVLMSIWSAYVMTHPELFQNMLQMLERLANK